MSFSNTSHVDGQIQPLQHITLINQSINQLIWSVFDLKESKPLTILMTKKLLFQHMKKRCIMEWKLGFPFILYRKNIYITISFTNK